MKIFQLHAETLLKRPLESVFAFFADAGNLQELTPPWLHFRILTPLPIALRTGARLDYQIRLNGLPLRWQSEITAWQPPHRFIDEQRRGPYRLWIHEHTFRAEGDSTRVADDVRYAVAGGAIVERLFVGRSLARIFRYREERIVALLGGAVVEGDAVSP